MAFSIADWRILQKLNPNVAKTDDAEGDFTCGTDDADLERIAYYQRFAGFPPRCISTRLVFRWPNRAHPEQ
jgi:hypothetical protein